MDNSAEVLDNPSNFQLKTNFLPCTVFQLLNYDLASFQQQIFDATSQAPTFFSGSPVVIDLEKMGGDIDIDFVKIKQILIENGFIPLGIRKASEEQKNAAFQASLPTLSIGKSVTFEKEKKKSEIPAPRAKLITTPIRSGMQVYAKEADLIVTAQVSPGAELLSDGHIHVYGALRGRALAGVQGDRQARIFCRALEAELVSIAGYYLTKEDIYKLPGYDGMIQIYLEGEQVKIESI